MKGVLDLIRARMIFKVASVTMFASFTFNWSFNPRPGKPHGNSFDLNGPGHPRRAREKVVQGTAIIAASKRPEAI